MAGILLDSFQCISSRYKLFITFTCAHLKILTIKELQELHEDVNNVNTYLGMEEVKC